jgi:hypothetical protein
VIVLTAVVPAMALMLLLGMAQLENRLLRPDRADSVPPHRRTATHSSRPRVIQRLALPRPKVYTGERRSDDPAWTIPDRNSLT